MAYALPRGERAIMMMMKKGVIFEQDLVGRIQQNSQTQSVPLPLSPSEEGPRSRPVSKREIPKWMTDFVCQSGPLSD